LVIQKGLQRDSVEVRVEENDPMGRRMSQEVTREMLADAQFDVVEFVVDHCVAAQKAAS
jgi:hypothetical protein